MKNIMKDDVVYYTIINKDNIDIKANFLKRQETLQGRYILNAMLDYFGLEKESIYITKLGKPYFLNQNVFFNYSHSKRFVACTISKKNVGIDIEDSDRILTDTMIKRCNLTQDDKLKELVQREAFCKLTGEGIAIIFNSQNFKNIDKNSLVIKNNDYICAICSELQNPVFEFIEI